ncbi:MAG: prepilin-type N-terminal cleavage/methylation domain-containing protein [Planctomycetales bacterium]|nr:prepilin-type N-terminal cleavage/methylation domain-containing protein [Planctomycetales bacterium]
MHSGIAIERPRRRGLSLLEMLACITIIGIVAAVIVPRLGSGGEVAKINACNIQRETIQIQSLLWRRATGDWPSSTLSDIGADVVYFPEGLPTCPLDDSSYTLDTDTGLVVGHDH